MPTQESVFSNYARFAIEGQVDISSAAAVSASRGDGQTYVRTTTGTYTMTLKAGGGLQLVKVLKAQASIMDNTASSTKSVVVTSVAQTASTGAIVVTFKMAATVGGAAADETTAAFTVSLDVVIQTARMTNPLA